MARRKKSIITFLIILISLSVAICMVYISVTKTNLRLRIGSNRFKFGSEMIVIANQFIDK